MRRLIGLWEKATARERGLLALGAAALLLAALYAALWRPALAARARLDASLPALRAELDAMRHEQRQVPALQKKAAEAPRLGDLREFLRASLSQTSFARNVERLEAVSAGRVQFVATLPFAAWLEWTGRLQSEAAVRIASSSISAPGPDGSVRVQALYVAPGAPAAP